MPLMLPPWASWIVGFLVRLINDWAARKRAEQALRDLGAATQANDGRREAERQEDIARRIDDLAEVAVDPRDYRD